MERPPTERTDDRPAGSLRPVVATERIGFLDVLRGFAILGILPVNMASFKAPVLTLAFEEYAFPGAVNAAVRFVTVAFFEQKFYTLFSFLFGLGFAVQIARAEARGVDIASTYVRRLGVLAAIGAVHAFLVWWGDILLTYALLGFALVPFRKCRPRTVFLWALGIFVVWAGITFLLAALLGLVSVLPDVDADAFGELANPAEARRVTEVYGTGTWFEALGQRARDVGTLYLNLFYVGPYIFAMFLFGLALGKAGLLAEPRRFLRPALRALLLLAPAAVTLNLVYAYADYRAEGSPITPWVAVGLTAAVLSVPALAATYAITIVGACETSLGRRVLEPLAAVGRTALSNYLLQSCVCTSLFYGYGLGWYGRVSPLGGAAIVVAVWAIQIPVSVVWMRRFHFGPAEWLWRASTYGTRPPMRR